LIVEEAVRVNLAVPPAVPLKVVGEKEAVTPEGSPVTDKFTVELKPPDGETDSVSVAGDAGETMASFAEEVIANDGVAIVRVVVALAIRFPPVTVIVRT
jgi:hypothetical protein